MDSVYCEDTVLTYYLYMDAVLNIPDMPIVPHSIVLAVLSLSLTVILLGMLHVSPFSKHNLWVGVATFYFSLLWVREVRPDQTHPISQLPTLHPFFLSWTPPLPSIPPFISLACISFPFFTFLFTFYHCTPNHP